MGDLNLVGSKQPLHTLLEGDIADEDRFGPDFTPDWDGTPLAGLLVRHANSRMTYTWSDATNSYAPARLDYFIYTDSLLDAGGFIFDTSEMPKDLLETLGQGATTGGELRLA